VVSRNELNAAAREELAALDRILAREPVGERHLELAALVDSVRAGAPRMDPAFAERLDAQVAAHGGGRRRARLRFDRPAARRVALASGGLVAAAVGFTIVISSGVLNGSKQAPHSARASGAPLTRAPAATPTANARTLSPSATTSGPVAATGAAGSSFAASPTLRGAARLVHRDSTLTLATSPASMQGVANQIVAATEHSGGVVQSSNVAIGRLIATVSALASVRALHQNTNDITDGYNQEQARLADNAAKRAALLKQLAAAATVAQQTAIQKQLSRLEARIAAEHREIDRLLTQGHTATLQVTIVPDGSVKHPAAAGPFTTAFNRALHALEAILAIALVAFAIVLPFVLSALALWWGATTVRQRARERAMRTA
jgi:hypothetical protein